MESKKGSLTIEASIALTAFMFVVVTVLSFATVYKAQSIVSHATLQTSQALAIESYTRETVSSTDTADLFSKMVKFISFLGFDINGADDWYASLGDSGTNLQKIARKRFAAAIAGKDSLLDSYTDNADKILEDAGIVDGLDGIDFAYSAVLDGNIIINVQYEVKLPFSFFGTDTVKLSKSAKTKAFKKISDNNGYSEPEEETDEESNGGSGGGGGASFGPEHGGGGASFSDGGSSAGGSSGGGGR